MNELVERMQCPFCLSNCHWRVVDQHWVVVTPYKGARAQTTITEIIHCMNKVEYDTEPGQFKECGCKKTIVYGQESEYDSR